jgi:putative ABC transport system permease protein
VALGLGILVAALTFTLLTSAVTTGAIQVRGTIEQNFRGAYDILVRPKGSTTTLERGQGLVRPNYLSGIFGGISVEQWRSIQKIPGVEVAAPIANFGYLIPYVGLHFPMAPYLTHPNELFRARFDWPATNGLSHYPGIQPYVYTTTDPRQCRWNRYYLGVGDEPKTPFELNGPQQSYPDCVVMRGGTISPDSIASGDTEVSSEAYFPILVAGIDPTQETKLVNLDGAVVGGRMLAEGEDYTPTDRGPVIPVIASDRTYVDQSLHVNIERLHLPAGASVRQMIESPKANALFGRLHGPVVGEFSLSAEQMYRRLLKNLDLSSEPEFPDVWTVSSADYRHEGASRLAALPAQGDPEAAWTDPGQNPYFAAPPGNQDVQYRRVVIYNPANGGMACCDTGLDVIGRFDPTKLPGFSPLSQVPLESYLPPSVEPADAASRQALGGKPLFPTMNLGGYVQQPPFLFTTIEAGQGLLDPKYVQGRDPTAPISVIRIRVAGVTGLDPVSLARIKAVALAIIQRTGLDVDITAGSSPAPMTVDIPAGEFGQPPLVVTEGWAKKGAAVVILQALDRKSLALFLLVLVVTSLFLVNGSLASVRARRTEIGTLLALGWTRRKVYEAVLGELVVVGLVAAVLGLAIAGGLVSAFDLNLSVAQTLLVVPIAIVLAVLAGVIPALLASRGHPLDAVRPAVAEPDRPRPVSGIVSMSLVNTRRVPVRTVLAAAGLFVGVGALTVLLSIGIAFKGTLVGTALGRVITLQIRPADYIAVAMVIVLGAASSADVLFLNIRERAAEFVTLSASGWGRMQLGELVTLEGLSIGLLGSVLGAATGLVVALVIAGSSSSLLVAAGLAAIGGSLLALLASLVPASLISRLAPPGVLAEE